MEEYANIYSSRAFLKQIDSPVEPFLGTQRCPYTVSAFLRFWDHVSTPGNSLKEDLFVWPEATMWRDQFTNPPEFFVSMRGGTKDETLLLIHWEERDNDQCSKEKPFPFEF